MTRLYITAQVYGPNLWAWLWGVVHPILHVLGLDGHAI